MFKCFDAAVILSGQAFNGFDKETGIHLSHNNIGKARFDRMSMVRIKPAELSVFFAQVTGNWYLPIGIWLTNCVFMRLKQDLMTKMIITFIISLTWCGLHISYLVSFLYLEMAGYNFRYIYKKFATYKILRNPVTHVIIL